MIAQIELVSGIFKLMDQLQPGIALIPRQANAVIAAADNIIEELRTPERTVRPGMGLSGWLASDCTGASSIYMVNHLVGYWGGSAKGYHYPHDAADFGRCLGLLSALPDLRLRLHEMAETGPEWAALIGAWDELTALYEADEFQQVSDRIDALTQFKLMETV